MHEKNFKEYEEIKRKGLATENDFTPECLEIIKESNLIGLIAQVANNLAYKLRKSCNVEKVDADVLTFVTEKNTEPRVVPPAG